MNLLEKLFSLKYAGLKIPFSVNLEEPVKASAVFNDSNYRANGSWYWKGDVVKSNHTSGIIGHDCHIYVRVRYIGSLKKRMREEFHSMQSTITDNEINFIAKDTSGKARYNFNIENLLLKADTFIIDKTTERNGKKLIKNFIHFSSKDLTGNEYEGYLVFSDNAVDSIFKKYLLELFSTNQVKS